MTDKIIYFTAGPVPTGGELDDIAALNAKSNPYEIKVRSAIESNSYGAGIEDADFVAGTIPSAYSAYTEFDIDSEPVEVDENDVLDITNSAASNSTTGTVGITDGDITVVLASTDQIVTHGDTIVVKNSAGTVSKNATATVAAGVISGAALASSVALVTDADVVTVKNSAETKTATAGAAATVAAGVVSKILLNSADAIVSDTNTVSVKNSAESKSVTGTATVVAGAVSKVKLAATEAIISSTQALTGVAPSGSYTNTVTFTVAGGVITAIVLS